MSESTDQSFLSGITGISSIPGQASGSGAGQGPIPISAQEAQVALGNILGPTNDLLKAMLTQLGGTPPVSVMPSRNPNTGNPIAIPVATVPGYPALNVAGEVEVTNTVQANVQGGTVNVGNLPISTLPQSLRPVLDVNVVAGGAGVGGGGPAADLTMMNNLAMYLNPYAHLNDAQLLEKFREVGLERYEYLIQTDRGRAMRKLDAAQEMNEYTQNILDYNRGKAMFSEEGFQRKAFDVFVKTGKTNPKGVPLEQTYRYLPKSIPEAHVKFNGKLYELIQGGTRMAMKNFKQIEALALKGGAFADELTGMRDIRQHIDKFDVPKNIIFKSRKI